jgi:broad specificity phosphatase PhoE
MKAFIISVCSLIILQQSMAQSNVPVGKNATIYIVRHAEKLSGEDPLLTPEGNSRSGDLMRTLIDKHIAKIYVSEFKRTQHTADSLHLNIGIDTVHYMADTSCTNLFETIINNKTGNKSILIISHSNIIQKIIYKLGIINFPQENLPAGEFDNLYIIHFINNKPSLEKKKYGKASTLSAAMKL